MRAGRLRHRVELHALSQTAGDFNEPVDTWTKFATVYADIHPMRGTERFEAAQVAAEATHKVRLRYDNDVSTLDVRDRVIFGDRTFEIVSLVNRGERNIEVEMLCAEAL